MTKLLELLGFEPTQTPVKTSSKGVLHVDPSDILNSETAKKQVREIDRIWNSGGFRRPEKEVRR